MKGKLITVYDDSGFGYGLFGAAECLVRCLDEGSALVLHGAHETVRGVVLRRGEDWLVRDDVGYERDLADYVHCDAEVQE